MYNLLGYDILASFGPNKMTGAKELAQHLVSLDKRY